MKIKKLPSEAQSKLQTGIIITDAVQCILELVHNSLDAEATAVAIKIDLKLYQIQVIDNGKGIQKDDLKLVGERFMTSKYHSLDGKNTTITYGFKGQAISSMLDVCKALTIKTKSEENGPLLIKEFQNNKPLPVTETDTEESVVGTTVIVEDFMCNMPVRRNRISEVFDINEMKTQLQYLAVIHYNVSFTLRNENKGTILFRKNPAESILQSISNTFGKTVSKQLKPVHYKDKNFEISGFIALKPQKQNNLQLFYLNKRIITKGVVHKFVNNLMKECAGSIVSLEDSFVEKDILKKLKNSFHNVFVIFMTCPLSFYELFSNSRKTTVEFRNWKDALKSVRKAIKKMYVFDKCVDEVFENIKPIPETKAKFGTSLLMNAIRGAPVKRALKKPSSSRRRKKKNAKVDMSFEVNSLNRVIDSTKDSFESSNKVASIKTILDKLNNPKRRKISKAKMPVVASEEQSSSFVSADESFAESPIKKLPKKRLPRHNGNVNQKNIKSKTDRSVLPTDDQLSNLSTSNIQRHSVHEGFKSPTHEVTDKIVKNTRRRKEKDFTFLTLENQESSFLNTKVEGTNDSFESPIPRNQLRIQNNKNYTVSKNHQILNSSFYKFYEWLKMKFEAETNGLNLQKDFLKPRSENLTNSPVFFQKSRKLVNENRKRFAKGELNGTKRFHILREETTETHTFLPLNGNSKANLVRKKLRNKQNVVSKQLCRPSSPSTSEVIFTNLIGLRNLSESFAKPFESKNLNQNITNTWKSHYENCANNLYKELEDTQKNICENYEHEGHNFTKRRNYGLDSDFYRRGFDLFRTETERVKQFRDAQTETDIIYSEKTNVMVQTDFQMVPETPDDEQTNHETENVLEITCQINPSQEVPNPDFWNFPTPQYEGTVFQPENIEKDLLEKATSSSEFICAQTSNSNKPPEKSTSKETQTLAKMWTDCLQEIGTENSVSFLESNQTRMISAVPEISDFHLTERHDFIPKGLSPTFVENKSPVALVLSSQEKNKIKAAIGNAETEVLECIKWMDESTGISTKPILPDSILERMQQKKEGNLFYYQNEILSASMSYCAVKIHDLLHSFAFTKELLSGVEILGQLDKKFIVAKMVVTVPKKMNLITLFDQHAVDERIQLEELLKVYVTPEGKLISSCVNPPIECLTDTALIQAVSNFEGDLINFGLNIHIINENTLSLIEIPTFLLDKYEKNLKNNDDESLKELLQNLINDVVKELCETRGAPSKIPKILHSAFCMEACRKAIKFNKFLTKESMDEMINKLRNCKLPFQCAHGRPSVIPIIDLEDFKPLIMKNSNVDVQKLKKFMLKRSQDIIHNSGISK